MSDDVKPEHDLDETTEARSIVPEFVSPRRKLFCEEYIKDFSGARAAARAGYSGDVATLSATASRLLNDDNVARYIAELSRNALMRSKIQVDVILAEAARIATVDIAEAFNDDGSLKRLQDMSPNVRRAIAGLEIKEYFEGSGQDRMQVGWIKKVKFADKTKALEMLGKYLSMWTDVTKHEGKLTLEQAIAQSYEKKGQDDGKGNDHD
jgi:phage terminase small subunit